MANFPTQYGDLAPIKESIPNVGEAGLYTVIDELDAVQRNIGLGAQGTKANMAERLAAMEAVQTAFGLGSVVGLVVENGATLASTARVTASLLAAEGSIIGNQTPLPFDVTCDITTTGLNGRMGSLADGWWYLWVGVNPQNGNVGTTLQKDITARDDLDLSDSTFEGFTRWRRVGAFPRVSGSFLGRRQQDRTVRYDDERVLTSTYRDTTFYTESAAVQVPATAQWLHLQCEEAAFGVNVSYFQFRPVGTSGIGCSIGGGFVGGIVKFETSVWLDSAQEFQWKMSAAQVSSQPAIKLFVVGYEDTL